MFPLLDCLLSETHYLIKRVFTVLCNVCFNRFLRINRTKFDSILQSNAYCLINTELTVFAK